MTKRKLVIVISSVVAALAVVAGGIFFGIASNTPSHPAVKQTTFKEITGLLTSKNEIPPSSMIVTPATQEWWDTMFPFRGSVQYERVSFTALEPDAMNMIFSNSSAASYEAFDVFQVPTVTFVYKDEKAAERAYNALLSNSDYAGITLVKNLLVLHPEASYAENELTLGALKNGLSASDLEAWGVEGDKAYWYLNLTAFVDTYELTIEGKEDKAIFGELASQLGIGDNTYWVGSSKDAAEWDGKFYGLDIRNFSPAGLNTYLAKQALALQTDGSWVRNGTDLGSYSGIVDSAQSALQEFSAFATKDNAVGSVSVYDNPDLVQLKPLAKDGKYVAEVMLDPNAWIGYLQGQGAQAPRVLFISTADIKVALDGTTKIKLDLITRSEYIESIEKAKIEAEANENGSGYNEESVEVTASEGGTESDVGILTEPNIDVIAEGD